MIDNFNEKIKEISFFLKNKKFVDAKHILDNLILSQPNNLDLLNILGIIFLETEKYLDAEKIFKK